MKEYIEREAVGKALDSLNSDIQLAVLGAYKAIDNIPAADVAPVIHGEWELKSEVHHFFDEVDEEFYVECPLCKRTFYVPFELTEAAMLKYAKEQYPYCHCGAKMESEVKENAR